MLPSCIPFSVLAPQGKQPKNIIAFWGLGKILCSRDNNLHQALTAILGLWLGISICFCEWLLDSPKNIAVKGRCWKALDVYYSWIKLPDMFMEAHSGGHKERALWSKKCQNRMNSFVCYTRYKETWYWVGMNLSTDRIMLRPCLMLRKIYSTRRSIKFIC